MAIKITSKNKKQIKVEVTLDFLEENFLDTEERIMDKVNALGEALTREALKKLEVEEKVISVNKERLYAKVVKKNIKLHMEKSK